MPTLLPRRLCQRLVLLLPLGLLGGCHSARPAFSFRPAPTVTAVAPTSADSVAEASLIQLTAQRQRQRHPAPRHLRARAAAPASARPNQFRPAPLRQRLLAPRPVARHHAARRPADEGRRPHDAFHIVLGAVLIVGAVLVGLWLGGWLGLGVGAAIMLLGDYFLVLGIGGKHAWLEIFQEFFNM